VEHGLARGLHVDRFAPRLSFFWDVHNDFFEEIAKLRAARRIWARHLRDRYGARDERSWKMRFHCQTAGVTLTAQQPQNNIVRVAYQALAAVLGGTQSLHTNALDETLALPTEESVRVALRTQQILAYETGVPNVGDPLGGSYYVEALTDALEREAEGLFAEIEAQGGVVQAIESGWFQRQIARSSMRFQSEVEQQRRTVVGVNRFVEDAEPPVEILQVGDEAERTQRSRLARLRESRDGALVAQRLAALRSAAAGDRNIIPAMLDCARAYCTLFEIRHVLEEIYGNYREPVFF
jgi:methylmalonyl-CoA mutase N-terminal domain/subunit